MSHYSATMRACEGILDRAWEKEKRLEREAVKFRRELAVWKADQAAKAAEAEKKKQKQPKSVVLTADWSRMTKEERQLIISLRKRGQTYQSISDIVGRPVETCRATFSRWRKKQHRENSRLQKRR